MYGGRASICDMIHVCVCGRWEVGLSNYFKFKSLQEASRNIEPDESFGRLLILGVGVFGRVGTLVLPGICGGRTDRYLLVHLSSIRQK